MKSGDMFLASRGSGEPPRAGAACGAARAATMRERTTPAQAGNRAAPAREGRCAVPRRTAVVEPPRSPRGAVARRYDFVLAAAAGGAPHCWIRPSMFFLFPSSGACGKAFLAHTTAFLLSPIML